MMEQLEIQKLKAFTINYLARMNKRQEAFFKRIEQERRAEDLLTVKEVVEQYSVSAKTVYRWRNNGLQYLQNSTGGKILVRREDLENYINTKNYGRQI